MPEIVKCKSCGAPMRWVKSEAGKMVPLDPEPVQDGNIILHDGTAHFLKNSETPSLFGERERYKSHFATCPHSKRWRKKDAEST